MTRLLARFNALSRVERESVETIALCLGIAGIVVVGYGRLVGWFR